MALVKIANFASQQGRWSLKQTFVAVFIACLTASCANAAVWPMWESWIPIGDVELTDTNGSFDNGDGTDETILKVDGKSAVTGQGVAYDFQGWLRSSESIEIDINLVNPGSEECRLTADFYNASDNRVIASSSEIVLAGGASSKVTLSMTASSADNNDLLRLRLIRSDDGSVSRDFAVDSVVLDGWYFPRTSNNPITPDLPLLPHDADLQTDMDGILESWLEEKLMNPTTEDKINRAVSDYEAFEVSVVDGQLTGGFTEIDQFRRLDHLGRAIAQQPNNPAKTEWVNIINNTAKLAALNLLSEQMDLDVRGYDTRHLIRDLSIMRDFLDQDAKDSFTYILYRNTHGFDTFWREDYPGDVSLDTVDTDQIYNYSDTLLIYALAFQDSSAEAQRWARGLKRYCDRFATPSRGTSNGIKVDGSGFHHWANYPRYLYAYRTFIKVLNETAGTQLQVEPDNYRDFRDAVIKLFVSSRERTRSLSMSGRGPLNTTINVDEFDLAQLAQAGGKILDFNTADLEAAAVYNSIYGVLDEFGVEDLNPLEGAFQFNYSNKSVYRRNGWTAIMKGSCSYFWGSEIYPTENRYGRYQSYGALQVIYPGGAEEGNDIIFDGWNWNYAPGTTTIVLPWDLLHAEKGRIDEEQGESFCGASTLGNLGSDILGEVHGRYGIFGMKFREQEGQGFSTDFGPNTHNDSFVFRKSVFTFDDLIIALGSNIANDDTVHNTVTTLYQRQAADSRPIVVNGDDYVSHGETAFANGSQRWVLDRYKTGYYVPQSNDTLRLSRKEESSPSHNNTNPSNQTAYTSGTIARLYLDHGASPSDAGYEYVTIPATTSEKIASFATRMDKPEADRPYRVMAKDSNHHIVRYQDNGKDIWGLALFEDISAFPHDCLLVSSVRPSLVMYELQTANHVLLSISDPDLGFESREYHPAESSQASLVLKGKWKLAKPNEKVALTALSEQDQTQLVFTLKDGLPEEVLLTTRDYSTWLSDHFNESEQNDINISGPNADPEGDNLKNVFEYIFGLDPKKNEAGSTQALLSGQNLDLSFNLSETFPGYVLDIESSKDLKNWNRIAEIFNRESVSIVDEDYSFEFSTETGMAKIRATDLKENTFLRLTPRAL